VCVRALQRGGLRPDPSVVEEAVQWASTHRADIIIDASRARSKEPLPPRRVRRWAFGLRELLRDAAGREHFARFLSKEFSGENLKFWLAVQELKSLPIRRVAARASEIWKEFLSSDAPSPVNVDAASRELTRVKVESGMPDRYCFDQAQAHVYHLMKSDSYSRYLRSDMYKEYLNGSKKKTSVKGIRSIVSFTGRKETSSN
ncbi:regulator of G-protein signaling 6-like, partial [Manduca sexta]|uniref:regulator of G-protein signaling 6-like n=1 Tax=Manduca sexta TaxID=7130 RepID=UPI00188E92ED